MSYGVGSECMEQGEWQFGQLAPSAVDQWFCLSLAHALRAILSFLDLHDIVALHKFRMRTCICRYDIWCRKRVHADSAGLQS